MSMPLPDEVVRKIAPSDDLLMVSIYGGWRIKQVGPYFVDVLVVLFNIRVVATPVSAPLTISRHFCYAGKSPQTLASAVLAAIMWDPTDGSEPAGWNKTGQTGEWRPPGGGHI